MIHLKLLHYRVLIYLNLQGIKVLYELIIIDANKIKLAQKNHHEDGFLSFTIEINSLLISQFVVFHLERK